MARQRQRSRLAIAVTTFIAAAYALLAAGIGLDRAAAAHPPLTGWVPPFLREQTLTATAKRTVLAGNPAQTLRMAERIVRHDPLGSSAAGLLGTARLASSNFNGAASAFRVSAKLGWRDAATQVYWFEAALRSQDFRLAGMRFGAIARQWPNAPAIDQLSARMEQDPRGFANLSQQIALGAKWARAYGTPHAGQPIERLAGRSRVLVAAGALGNKLGCANIAALVGTLTAQEPRLANELWQAQCPRAAPLGQLADPGFELQPLASPVTAFDWQFPGNGALESTIAHKNGDRRLRLQGTAASLVPTAMQSMILPAGRYQLSWLESGDGPSRLAVSLSCRPELSLARPAKGLGTTARRSAVLEFAGDCVAPLLQLWLAPGSREVYVDDVAIKPL